MKVTQNKRNQGLNEIGTSNQRSANMNLHRNNETSRRIARSRKLLVLIVAGLILGITAPSMAMGGRRRRRG